MTNLSDRQIESSLGPYGFSASAELCAGIRAYIDLLLHWNRRISLTTVTDPIEILRFHFGESLYALSLVPIQYGRLADVGSGAGFPGLALRMGAPNLHIVLIESNMKKAAFLSEVSRELSLDQVDIFRGRMRDLSVDFVNFHFVTARATGQRSELLKWSASHLRENGKVVLWLGERDLSEMKREDRWSWESPHLIPGSKRRFMVSGSRAH